MKYIKINDIKLLIGSILVVFLVLFDWKLSYSHSGFSLIFPAILLSFIAYGLIEIKIHKRACFKNCYVKKTSFFAKLLSSKIMVSIFYFLASVAITISIMHNIIDYQKELWIYIMLHIIIVIIIFKSFNKLLVNTIHNKYLYLFSREATVNVSILLLFGVYLYVILTGYEPEYLRKTLQGTIKAATNSIHSEYYPLDYILRLKTELDALFWWSVKSVSGTIDNYILKYFLWAGFVVINGLAVIGINRFIVQVVYVLDMIFNPKQENNNE